MLGKISDANIHQLQTYSLGQIVIGRLLQRLTTEVEVPGPDDAQLFLNFELARNYYSHVPGDFVFISSCLKRKRKTRILKRSWQNKKEMGQALIVRLLRTEYYVRRFHVLAHLIEFSQSWKVRVILA